MGTTYETPEEKEALIQDIKTQIAEKHGIESTEGNALLDDMAKTEFSRRVTQASYTKGQQALKQVEAEKQFLHNELTNTLDLSITQNEELEKLKYEDPDKYIETVGKLKTQRKSEFDKTITDGLSHAGSEASKNFALSRREEILKDFSDANPGFNLTDSMVRDQLPPVLVNQLANSEISFGDFLEKAKLFVTGNKRTSKAVNKDLDDNFKDLKGSQTVSKDSVKNSIIADYDNMTF